MSTALFLLSIFEHRSTAHSAWLGWFPVLFYSSVYVGELHKRASPLGPDADPAAIQALQAEANRLGSRALFYSAVLSLAMNILLPFFVSETSTTGERSRPTCADRMHFNLGNLWTLSHAVFAGCMMATLYVSSSLSCLRAPGRRLTHCSFTSSVFGATMLISITGFSWAISMWAPFVLVRMIYFFSVTVDEIHISFARSWPMPFWPSPHATRMARGRFECRRHAG